MTSATEVEQPRSTPDADDVSTPVRDWLKARPGRPVMVGAAAILALQFALRGWLGMRGYFFLDDFAFTSRAATMHVSDPSYLLLSYNSHVMPGSFVWVWILTKLAPLSFGPVVAVDLVLQLVLGIVFYRLLKALFGLRPMILVPFAVGTLSPITLPAFLWWAAALNQLPEQIAMVTALLYHVRYLRSGRTRTGIYGAVAVACGLAFSEKSLIIVPLVVGFTALYAVDGSPWRRLQSLARKHFRVWCAYLLVAVPYSAYYLFDVPSPARGTTTGAALGQLVTQSFGHAVIPGLLGGPWTWIKVGEAGGLADPTPFARVLALVVVATLIVITCALRRRAVFGWVLALGYAVVNLALLAVSRATFIGPVIGDEYRYVTDVAIVAAIGGALSVLPLAGVWAAGGPARLLVRPAARAAARSARVHELRAALPRPGQGLLAALLVVAFIASATVSSLRYDADWRVNPARPYMTTVRAQLATAPAGLVLADERVPSRVAWALLGQYAFESKILAPLPDAPDFLQPGQTTTGLSVLDDSGRIQPARIWGFTALPGRSRNCGWRLGGRPVDITMSQAASSPATTDPLVIRIGYIASEDATAQVRVGNSSLTVPFRRGLGAVWFLAYGSAPTVRISALSTAATVCTDDVSVGAAIAAPAPTGSAS